jgi:hypothetical protein
MRKRGATTIAEQRAACGSEAKPLQVLPLTLEIVERVWLERVTRPEKPIERLARAKAEQPAQLGPAQTAELVFLERQHFENATSLAVPSRRARSSGM